MLSIGAEKNGKINIEVLANPNPSFGWGTGWSDEPPSQEWQTLVLNTERLMQHVGKHLDSYRFRHETPQGPRIVIIGTDVLEAVSESIPNCLRRPFVELHIGEVMGCPVWFVASITGTAVVTAK